MFAQGLVITPELLPFDAVAERGARRVRYPCSPVGLAKRCLEPVRELLPIGPVAIVDRDGVDRHPLFTAGRGELFFDLRMDASGGKVRRCAIRGSERALDAWKREGVGDVLGHAAHMLVQPATFDDVGNEGNFVVHLTQDVMQFARMQDRRDG